MKNQIIYSLITEDIQYVAQQEIGRDLSYQEIEKIINTIADKIKWYDIITESINEKIQVRL